MFRTHVNCLWRARKQARTGVLLRLPAFMIACCSSASTLEASCVVYSRAGGALEWLHRRCTNWRITEQTKTQDNLFSNLMRFTHSNTRVCFNSSQESRSRWFGAPPWRKSTQVFGGCPYSKHKSSGAFARWRKATTKFVMSLCLAVHPHGTTRVPVDGFSWKVFFTHF